MIEGLRRAGVDVAECHAPLWAGVEDRVRAVSGGWFSLRFIARVLKVYRALLSQYRQTGDYDVMVVGYPGPFDVYIARLLTWLRRKPLVWDIFMSIYLIAIERGLRQRSRLTVWAIRLIERLACRLPDRLILDTAEYVEWFGRAQRVKSDRFRLVPTGADDRVFRPRDTPRPDPQSFTAIYYGSFTPNHGVPVMIEAARLVADDPAIRFVLIGDGPEKDGVRALAHQYRLANVTFIDWVDQSELPGRLAQADVCLGVFGTTPQSTMTVQNKIYEALAMRKPVITGDAATIRASFENGEHLILVNRNDACELADAIRRLRRNPELREALARNGYQKFCESFTTQKIGERTRAHLEQIVLESVH
jgi:glycosyltransferase involved in cell wall biosynthesis